MKLRKNDIDFTGRFRGCIMQSVNKFFFIAVMVFLLNTILAQSYQKKIIIQPSMGISIKTYPDSTSPLSGFYVVNDEGTIELPYVGFVEVNGKDKYTLKKQLLEKLKKYIRSNDIKLDVYYRLGFVGGFENPGLYYVRPDESFWEALRRTGGFLGENGFKKMKIYRGDKELSLDIENFIASGKSLREIGIENGDIFTTPIPGAQRDLFQRFTQVLSIVATTAAVYFTYVTIVINARRGR